MNTDDIEVCVEQPDEIIRRVDDAMNISLRQWDPEGCPNLWSVLIDPDYRLSVSVAKMSYPIGATGPTSWDVELRGCFVDLDDERDLEIRRWVVGYLWDALAAGTDWHLIWWSDDDPGDGIIKQRRSVHGPNVPSLDEQMEASRLYLEQHS